LKSFIVGAAFRGQMKYIAYIAIYWYRHFDNYFLNVCFGKATTAVYLATSGDDTSQEGVTHFKLPVVTLR